MPQLNVIVDDTTAEIVRTAAKKQGVSLSHYLNNLIQRGLMLEDNTDSIASLLQEPTLLRAFQKQFKLNVEMASLMRYLVKNLHEETTEEGALKFLDEAKSHAESYTSGVFE